MNRRGDGAIVIGGGLAGIAAAWRLANAGVPVTLIERRPFLGGRAFSFRDPDSDAEIDNGQHVLIGACTRLRALFSAIGSPRGAFRRQRRFDIPVYAHDGTRSRLRAAPLPAPLHLAAAIARYGHLNRSERWSVARSAHALATRSAEELYALEDRPLGDWFRARGVSAAEIDRFWEPFVRPALNIRVRDANLPLAAMFVRRAMWGRAADGAIWIPTVGLSEAIGVPARAALERAGVVVLTSARALAIVTGDAGVDGVALADETIVPGHVVITALPPRALARLKAPSIANDEIAALDASSAIVNVYLWYDREVSDFAFAASLDSDLQWMFNRTQMLGRDAGGPCLGVSLSAADVISTADKEEIVARTDDAVARALPRRSDAALMRSAVVKEPHATFRATPGVNRLRPGPLTAVRGWYLAGDWTDTGWPATMEGAVRSGEAAARAALEGALPIEVER